MCRNTRQNIPASNCLAMIIRGKVARYIHIQERFQTSLPIFHRILAHARVEGHDKVGLCMFVGGLVRKKFFGILVIGVDVHPAYLSLAFAVQSGQEEFNQVDSSCRRVVSFVWWIGRFSDRV